MTKPTKESLAIQIPGEEKPLQIHRENYSTIESTQDLGIAAIKELKPGEYRVFTAEEQTKGRGEGVNRRWASPPNVNIYATFSFLLHTTLSKSHIDLVVAYAIASMLKELGFAVTIKWVNDVLINGKKVCGILPQVIQEVSEEFKDKYVGVVIGVGLNINMAKEICDSLDQPVTSLLVENPDKKWDKEEIFQKLTQTLISSILLLAKHGFQYFQDKISAMMSSLDEEIYFLPTEKFTAIKAVLKGVDSDGSLVIQNGKQCTSYASGTILRGKKLEEYFAAQAKKAGGISFIGEGLKAIIAAKEVSAAAANNSGPEQPVVAAAAVIPQNTTPQATMN